MCIDFPKFNVRVSRKIEIVPNVFFKTSMSELYLPNRCGNSY